MIIWKCNIQNFNLQNAFLQGKSNALTSLIILDHLKINLFFINKLIRYCVTLEWKGPKSKFWKKFFVYNDFYILFCQTEQTWDLLVGFLEQCIYHFIFYFYNHRMGYLNRTFGSLGQIKIKTKIYFRIQKMYFVKYYELLGYIYLQIVI